jgi:hypothetical protein
MSAGVFTISKYEADSGDIHPIKVQPETLTANIGSANTAPTAAVDNNLFARTGGGNRAYGVRARYVTVRFTGAAPDGYAPNTRLRIPVMTQQAWDDAVAGETTGTYLGSAIQVVSKVRESGRG